jgi:hypothetical protein
MTLRVEPFNSRKHRRSDFYCGQDSLDNYIRHQASQDLKKRVSTVFVLIDVWLSAIQPGTDETLLPGAVYCPTLITICAACNSCNTQPS